MAKSNSTDFTLNKLDDLFSTQDERDNADKPEIRDIDISLIDDFPNHPFKVTENEELFDLVESIKEQGVLIPAIVRPKENGRYEMIAGHRRKRASELALFSLFPLDNTFLKKYTPLVLGHIFF